VTVELSRRLLASGIPSADIEAALFLSVARGIPVARALIDRGVVTERALEEELGRWAGIALRQVTVATDLWARLPMSMCRRLGALPVRLDSSTGTVEVAAIDPLDPHVGAEFSFHLGMPVRVQRATLGAIEEAVRRLELGETDSGSSRSRRRTPAFPHGAPKSSVPPPPAEEVPIPLVRRIGTPLIEPDDGNELALVTPRLARSTTPDASQPAVSFPSSPPPAMGGPAVAAPVTTDGALSGARGRASTPRLGTPSVASSHDPRAGVESRVVVDSPDRAEAKTPSSASVASSRPASSIGAHAPASGSPAAMLSGPPRSVTPMLGTMPAVSASNPSGDWSIPSETLEDGFRRASGEHAIDARDLVRGGEARREVEVSAPYGDEYDGSEETTQVRGAVAPPPLPMTSSLEEALDRLGDAQGRDAIVEAAIAAICVLAPRAALFVVRRDGYYGWACSPPFGNQVALREVIMPHKVPSILATATAAGFYLGPIPNTPGHGRLLGVMKNAGPDVAVSVVRVAGKPAMVLIADGLDDTLRGTRALGEIAKVAGFALSRVLASR
jgi:hypothetical protein